MSGAVCRWCLATVTNFLVVPLPQGGLPSQTPANQRPKDPKIGTTCVTEETISLCETGC
jgi:hypothetical protein